MKKTRFSVLLASVLAATSLAAIAEEPTLVDIVAKGCEKELNGYCKDVTPGEGRVLACLYAHSDKLSGQCEFALYDAAVQLERAVAALTYVANECEDDIDTLCAGVEAGEGRLLSCLDKHDKKVSQRCKAALKDVGLKD